MNLLPCLMQVRPITFSADNYKLRPLSERKKVFISENKHLPNIPAAAEIEKNGIQLGDISKCLMEKVEEASLCMLFNCRSK